MGEYFFTCYMEQNYLLQIYLAGLFQNGKNHIVIELRELVLKSKERKEEEGLRRLKNFRDLQRNSI